MLHEIHLSLKYRKNFKENFKIIKIYAKMISHLWFVNILHQKSALIISEFRKQRNATAQSVWKYLN